MPQPSPRPSALDAVCLAQGVYFLASGAWPWIHLESFERVTGPKHDHWLVKTVGALVAVVGGVLVDAAVRGRAADRAVALTAVGTAAALAAIDVNFVQKGRISPVYLADALVEALIVGAWQIGRDSDTGASAVEETVGMMA